MNSYAESRSRAARRKGVSAPAYGPIDAALGFALFYYLVARGGPTIEAVVTELFATVSPATVGFGLAGFLWFVFVVTTIDQVRRQLAALGVGSERDVSRQARSRGPPSSARLAAYLGLILVGGGLALATFASAIDTAIALLPALAALDVGAFVSVEFVVMVVFFVSYSVATHSLDRLLIGGLRALLSTPV
ncbi:hypothetical protein [Haladaptatus sp. CMSO5]|uniref:hypothetical protein n=1 Tax=Haladaptatus sp. CMSO5 TaxID=3120514 RepID=UPI002FCE6165